MLTSPLSIYSDFLTLTFPIPIYDYYYQTRETHSHIKLYLISSYREKNTLLFGILIGSPSPNAYYIPEILNYLATLEMNNEISQSFPGWQDTKRFFINAVLSDEKILTRYRYINNCSPIGPILLPPLVDVEKLVSTLEPADPPIKLMSHYVLKGNRGFFVVKDNQLSVLNRYGEVELEDTSDISDEVYTHERLFLEWARRVMRDHFLSEPFVIGFIYTHRQFVVDLIGVKKDKMYWQTPVFSVGCFHLGIFDVRKCPGYTVYISRSIAYRQQMQSVIIDTVEACPVKPFLNTPTNITTNFYWVNEKASFIDKFYYLKSTSHEETNT